MNGRSIEINPDYNDLRLPGSTVKIRSLIRGAAGFGLLLAGAMMPAPAAATGADVTIEEIVVTSRRRGEPLDLHAGNAARLDAIDIASVTHRHIHELLTRVPGTWISRGSGQEHLTAIRSPVLTGAGSCGAFLYLEDSIPTRPSGFCNVNQLFESNTELASAIEVLRGPGTALHGSNALHGIVNVLLPEPGDGTAGNVGIEAGANEFVRVRASSPFDLGLPGHAGFVYADDGGFRDDSGYRQFKGNLKLRADFLGGDLVSGLSVTDLDQETAGFILGKDAYRDPDINRTNPNPEAFRDASSARLYATWQKETNRSLIDVRPFLRVSSMEFLQHFLPGQPLEENGQVSAGFLSTITWQQSGRRITLGFDFEWADVFLKETQFGPTGGSDFLNETRPEGKHYDFDVTSLTLAPYIQADFDIGERLVLGAGLRAEYAHYDYNNRMLDGNTRDDGTPCGFGGCLYTRPSDRSDDFTNLAPSLSMTYRLSTDAVFYASAARGFRAPQITELYRLQNGQTVADLDSERVDNVEVGLRGGTDRWSADLSLFAMRKSNSVYRDPDGFSVSGGKSRHEGAELGLDWQFTDRARLSIDAGYGRHTYDFDATAQRGTEFVSGRDVDTAPRWLGSAELFIDPTDRIELALQWTMIGEYYLEPENRHSYPGHDLWNLRASFDAYDRLDINLRLLNVLDTDLADRADFAFGNYRYFPGRGRELFVEFVYTAAGSSTN